MEDRRLRRKLVVGITVCSIITVAVVSAAIAIIGKMQYSLNDLIFEQMVSKTDDYINHISSRIDRNYQAIDTLAAYMIKSDTLNSSDISEILDYANQNNDFLSMSLFKPDGTGIIVSSDHKVKSIPDYHALAAPAADSLSKAFAGDVNMSDLFHSEVQDNEVFVYSLPIKVEGNVVAVLTVSDRLSGFNEAINDTVILNGHGAIHLVDGDGRILLSSKDIGGITNIYDKAFLSEGDYAKLEGLLFGETDDAFMTIMTEKDNYFGYLQALGVNDWYILCTRDSQRTNNIVNSMIQIMGIMFTVLVILLIGLMIFITRSVIKTKRHIDKIAFTDSLTGADSMLKFTKNLELARSRDSKFSIAMLNIRNFRFINEIFGSEEADRLLCVVSDKIRERLIDGEFFAREYADCFYIYLKKANKDAVEGFIQGLISNICKTQNYDKDVFKLKLYSGIYIHNSEDEENISDSLILTRVGFAARYCQNNQQVTIQFYDKDMHGNEELQTYIDNHAEKAITDMEFKVYLQPKMDLRTHTLSGAEALVRWQTKDKGMLFPDTFIPQFERSGFCVQLDLYMVEQACRILRHWIDSGKEPVPISVNQSKLLFYRTDYIDSLEAIISKYDIPARLITLEILEDLALENPEEMNIKLCQLRKIGFKISMDDFGSGYSSFNTLGNLEIDELKLDRAFLLELSKSHSERFCTIMESVMKLSKKLHISTVTEGVETPDDEKLITALGCDYSQGYLYSKPISADEFGKKYMGLDSE